MKNIFHAKNKDNCWSGYTKTRQGKLQNNKVSRDEEDIYSDKRANPLRR